MWQQLLSKINNGNSLALSKAITMVENEMQGHELLLQNLPLSSSKLIGITGPPGAGKSTLTEALIKTMVEQNFKVGVLCVDPSSPYHRGALLGDRIRMNEWFTNKNVFIRSLASRGALGGLSPKIIEITDVMRAAQFDYIIIETVGVGQSEVEIASMADITLVVLVPESGDEIQTMKAGLMEVADVFVVNKCDRPDAELFVQYLHSLMPSDNSQFPEIIKTTANKREGVAALFKTIQKALLQNKTKEEQLSTLTEKAWQLIQQKMMKHIEKKNLQAQLATKWNDTNFNLYAFVAEKY